MRRFTKDELDTLSFYEDRFNTAINSAYYRNVNSGALVTIANIYREATDETISTNFGCSTCILNFLRKVGEKYFKDKKAFEEAAKNFVEVLDEIFEDVKEDEVPVTVVTPAVVSEEVEAPKEMTPIEKARAAKAAKRASENNKK